MGKRNNKHNKKLKSKKESNNRNNYDNNNNDNNNNNVSNDNSMNTLIMDTQKLLNNLKNDDMSVVEKFTNTLANFQFFSIKENNEVIKVFCDKNVLQCLVDLILSNNSQICCNSISSLINLLFNLSDTEIDKILLKDTNFNEIIYKYIIKKGQNINVLINLLNLILDLGNDININIINEVICFLCKENNISDKLCENILKFLCYYFENVFYVYNEKDMNVLDLLFSYFSSNSNKNSIINSYINYISFYISLSNSKYNQNIQKNIENVYESLCSINMENLKNLDTLIVNIEKNENEVSSDDNKLNALVNSSNQDTICYLNDLKLLDDIISSIEIQQNNKTNNIMEEEYEEISDENNDNINNEDNDDGENDEYKTAINNIIYPILKTDNFLPLKKILNQNLIEKLAYFSEFYMKIPQFFIHENNLLVKINENLKEIKDISYSLINNIISKFDTFITENDFKFIYDFINKKLNEQINNNSSNEDIDSLFLILRNLLENHSNLLINSSLKDYEILFNLLDKSNINNKCNIIDIINFIACKNNNYKISEKYKDILSSENNMEVACHILNSYMDIFKNDDIDSNNFLYSLSVINLMKNNIKELKNRVKSQLNEGIIDNISKAYCNDTILNLKRFIKYKEKSWIQLGMIK